jgi:plasmid stabilization system protein ParE
MSVDAIRSDDSIRDVENIARYYMEQETPATALKFARAVEKTLSLLAMFPEMGSPWESNEPRLQGVRFQNVSRFRNYLIFYRMTEPGLYVERIVDGRRDLERIL